MSNEMQIDFNELKEVQSLCMRCHQQGITKVLGMQIPFFREVMLLAFECPECHYKSNELAPLNQIQDHGVRFELKVKGQQDLDRMIVVQGRSALKIPDIEFEIDSLSQGHVTTVQGLLSEFIEDLTIHQEERKISQPEIYEKIEQTIFKLWNYVNCNQDSLPFHLIVEDASGNSFISNPNPTITDTNMRVTKFEQTKDDLYKLGFVDDQEYQDYLKEKEVKKEEQVRIYKQQSGLTDQEVSKIVEKMKRVGTNQSVKLDEAKAFSEAEFEKKIMLFQQECLQCGKNGEIRVCECSVPFFKSIVLISFVCETCGYKNSEIKTGGEISKMGMKMTLKVENADDLNRDFFKSDSAMVRIDEVGLELAPGCMGSFYSTIEGFLEKVIDQLTNENPFVGDSSDPDQTQKFKDFISKVEKLKSGQEKFTLFIEDPLDNCFIYSRFYPQSDAQIVCEPFERTQEMNEELGILYLIQEDSKEKQVNLIINE